jgi:hypothetical protein
MAEESKQGTFDLTKVEQQEAVDLSDEEYN